MSVSRLKIVGRSKSIGGCDSPTGQLLTLEEAKNGGVGFVFANLDVGGVFLLGKFWWVSGLVHRQLEPLDWMIFLVHVNFQVCIQEDFPIQTNWV